MLGQSPPPHPSHSFLRQSFTRLFKTIRCLPVTHDMRSIQDPTRSRKRSLNSVVLGRRRLEVWGRCPGTSRRRDGKAEPWSHTMLGPFHSTELAAGSQRGRATCPASHSLSPTGRLAGPSWGGVGLDWVEEVGRRAKGTVAGGPGTC